MMAWTNPATKNDCNAQVYVLADDTVTDETNVPDMHLQTRAYKIDGLSGWAAILLQTIPCHVPATDQYANTLRAPPRNPALNTLQPTAAGTRY